MTQEEFLTRLSEEIQLDRVLHADEILCNIPEWDSLAMLGVLSVFDEIDVAVEINELENCKSIKDILSKAGFDA